MFHSRYSEHKLECGTDKLMTRYFRCLYSLLIVIFWDFHKVLVCLIYFKQDWGTWTLQVSASHRSVSFRTWKLKNIRHCLISLFSALCRALQDLKFLILFLITLNNIFFHIEMKILGMLLNQWTGNCLFQSTVYMPKAAQMVCSSTLGGRMNSKALGLITGTAHRWQYLVQNAVVRGLLEF